MERMLQKLAKQLNQYDQASLMSLWEKYAAEVARFEPSTRWEESVLIFSMIQAVHFKNQLFNLGLASSTERGKRGQDTILEHEMMSFIPALNKNAAQEGGETDTTKDEDKNSISGKSKQGCKVLVFRPRDAGQS